MLIRPLSLSPLHPALPPPTPGYRRAGAAALHAAGHLLHSLALRLAQSPAAVATRSATPLLEFHAEAGAPEGALYVDGRLVGHLVGVSRL